ncbi:unnamed protein product [Polarella glacialis]|uniref:Thioredoxin domain-containing protein n=1 Tax=Polarella glacialis TaxID=89957 RepID=A0A813EK59_POLGL|nr:unnamed protein product [Polarella glacialis]|mmetsp:Transcript_54069/g.87383  ORF Transcript_54069/g.87383 Transcript_54069/m.87383 type:complete len:156 (-) Transcript_54069:70-537(-)|eukprot:CAMPEP_0115102400 /NCGR_PEP_ID=MMETSP0227-20121206/33880_1 /TAXON_ID=89957 /ORGANISM="Polarella glacialis, Strain CCMP 1383" /LENGTH=155 /DNA_ID=CAMNT_0002498485 /DNA_START=66 /DNA_END=533 /DNA_ORIENTATION=+
MAMRLTRRCLNLPAIKDFAQYEAIKTTKSTMMVGFFTGHWSAASKMYKDQFEAMSKAYPKATFYTCDVDDAPLAAYDSEVIEVPSVVIQPLGLKPDGSYYDRTDMVVVAPELAQFDQVISRAKAAVDAIHVMEIEGDKKPWTFDPATGTTLPPHQ